MFKSLAAFFLYFCCFFYVVYTLFKSLSFWFAVAVFVSSFVLLFLFYSFVFFNLVFSMYLLLVLFLLLIRLTVFYNSVVNFLKTWFLKKAIHCTCIIKRNKRTSYKFLSKMTSRFSFTLRPHFFFVVFRMSLWFHKRFGLKIF